MSALVKSGLTARKAEVDTRKQRRKALQAAVLARGQEKSALELRLERLRLTRERLDVLEEVQQRTPSEQRKLTDLRVRETVLSKAVAEGEDQLIEKELTVLSARAELDHS